MKRSIKFLDAKNNLVKADCEITHRNGYPEFTMSGEYCGCHGQCLDSVDPDTDSQKELINLWRTCHLNGMNAGTLKQEAIIADYKKDGKYSYDNALNELSCHYRSKDEPAPGGYTRLQGEIENLKKEIEIIDLWHTESEGNRAKSESRRIYGMAITDQVEKLKHDTRLSLSEYSNNDYYILTRKGYVEKLNEIEEVVKQTMVYDIHPKTGELYKYGSGWIVRKLPENFEDDLNELLDKIESDYNDSLDELVTEDDLDLFQEFYRPEVALALALMVGLHKNEIEGIDETSDTYWSVHGEDFLCGTDEDMDELWDDDLENYLDECVIPELPETAQQYFDREAWKRDARYDGREHSLNRYDGSELWESINGIDYFAYKQ